MRLAADGADNSDRHRIVETLGAADSEHNLPLTGAPPGLVEWDGRQPGGLYLQERNIGFAICADNDGIQHLPFSQRFAIRAHHHGIQDLLFSRAASASPEWSDFGVSITRMRTCIPYHMLIGDDVSRGIDDRRPSRRPGKMSRSRHLHRWLMPKHTSPKPAPARPPALPSRPIAPARR